MNCWLVSVGLLAISIIFYSLYKNSKTFSIYLPLIDAASEAKYEGTLAHLWFEEHITGDPYIQKREVINHLAKSQWLLQAMLYGADGEERRILPLKKERMREKILLAQKRLQDFRDILEFRISQKEVSQPGTAIDQKFDSLFKAFIDQTEEVKTELNELITQDNKNFQTYQLTLAIICFVMFAVFSVVFRKFNQHRSEAFEKLYQAKHELENQISQRSKIEIQLRQSQNDLKQAENIANIGNWVYDAKGEELRWSDLFAVN